MKLFTYAILFSLLIACQPKAKKEALAPSLADAFKGRFMMGTALNSPQTEGKDTVALNIVQHHFNSIVAENCMKSEVLQPNEGEFDFRLADQIVELAAKSNAFMVGHTLIWHSQTAPWMFVDENGAPVARDTLIERMRTHIHTVVGRYKGRVHGWDVVNEALLEDGSFRQSPYYKIIGEEFIELAFQFANEADPDAELYYNDYNMYKLEKSQGAIKLAKTLKNKGIRIDGIGMQAHYGLHMDIFDEIEASINSFSDNGLKVMITELDVSVLPFPTEELTAEVSQNYAMKPEYNPYVTALPDSVQTQLASYYQNLFEIYKRQSDKISRITFWGVNDDQTWRNYWPIQGRTDYPLLFDRNNEVKPAFDAVIKTAQSQK
ncbi:endo-1,4-beta-xylanase [Carboxylicivirga sp. RSCT41]|uniref:endo-1,4-beta-xylanase n=1 Tax=Carboxylicivirga agarovorans TaxID=3417570 RepID=UPI003D33AC6B